jgi:hypothetical protein
LVFFFSVITVTWHRSSSSRDHAAPPQLHAG